MLSMKWGEISLLERTPTQSLMGSPALPWTYIPTEAEHEEGEEGKDAVGRKRPRHTRERLKVRERIKAAGRRLQGFCLSL